MLLRQQVHAGDGGLEQDVVDVDAAFHQQVVDGQVELHRVDAEADRQRALRVEVDQQHPAAVLGQRRAQVDGRGGLADPALLVAHGDDLRRAVLGQRRGDREVRQRPAGGADPLAALRGRVRGQRGGVLGVGLYLGVGVEPVLEAQLVVDAVRVVDLDVPGPGARGALSGLGGAAPAAAAGCGPACGSAYANSLTCRSPSFLTRVGRGPRPAAPAGHDGASVRRGPRRAFSRGSASISTYVFIALTP